MALEAKSLPLTGRAFELMTYAALANVSRALGNATAADAWATAAAATADTINARFLNSATGVYSGPGWNRTQCGQALPLFLQIVPPTAREAAVSALVDAVEAQGRHFAVGAYGVKWLLMALTDAGRADLAGALMGATTYPGAGWRRAGGRVLESNTRRAYYLSAPRSALTTCPPQGSATCSTAR